MSTFEEKLAAVRREVKFRERVYARRVADHKMTMVEATKGIRIMEEIARDYEAAIAKQSPTLF